MTGSSWSTLAIIDGNVDAACSTIGKLMLCSTVEYNIAPFHDGGVVCN